MLNKHARKINFLLHEDVVDPIALVSAREQAYDWIRKYDIYFPCINHRMVSRDVSLGMHRFLFPLTYYMKLDSEPTMVFLWCVKHRPLTFG